MILLANVPPKGPTLCLLRDINGVSDKISARKSEGEKKKSESRDLFSNKVEMVQCGLETLVFGLGLE